eukprot:4653906-Amphidinium_carterae.1
MLLAGTDINMCPKSCQDMSSAPLLGDGLSSRVYRHSPTYGATIEQLRTKVKPCSFCFAMQSWQCPAFVPKVDQT